MLVILICGLTLALLWVLGGKCVPGAQTGPPAHLCFAPQAAGADPSSNVLTVPTTGEEAIPWKIWQPLTALGRGSGHFMDIG